jgi:hypothetical protein
MDREASSFAQMFVLLRVDAFFSGAASSAVRPESADQADGCPATSLAVNSNPGVARFESVNNGGSGGNRTRVLEASQYILYMFRALSVSSV